MERSEATIEFPDFSDPIVKMEMAVRKRIFEARLTAAIEVDDPLPEPDDTLLAFLEKREGQPLIITSGSAEGIVRAAKRSACGIVLIVDELNGFFAGSGATARKQMLFASFDAAPDRSALVTRSDSAGEVTLSFIGASTPQSLARIGLDSGTGLAGRAIVACESSPPARGVIDPADDEYANSLLTRLHNLRYKDLPVELEFSSAAITEISDTVTTLQHRAPAEVTAVRDALAGVDAILFRMAAALQLLANANGKIRPVSLESARSACRIYTSYILPSISGLFAPQTNELRDVIIHFVGQLIEVQRSDRVNRRSFMRSHSGIDLRGIRYSDFEHTLLNSGVATVEFGPTNRQGGAPEKFLVINPDYIAAYREARAENSSTQKFH